MSDRPAPLAPVEPEPLTEADEALIVRLLHNHIPLDDPNFPVESMTRLRQFGFAVCYAGEVYLLTVKGRLYADCHGLKAQG